MVPGALPEVKEALLNELRSKTSTFGFVVRIAEDPTRGGEYTYPSSWTSLFTIKITLIDPDSMKYTSGFLDIDLAYDEKNYVWPLVRNTLLSLCAAFLD